MVFLLLQAVLEASSLKPWCDFIGAVSACGGACLEPSAAKAMGAALFLKEGTGRYHT